MYVAALPAYVTLDTQEGGPVSRSQQQQLPKLAVASSSFRPGNHLLLPGNQAANTKELEFAVPKT